jgi:hypothetical protein
MNCQQCQRRLMAAEQLEDAALAIEAHLGQCETCRQFRRQLVRIEANVPRLPLPPSRAKQTLLNQILAGPAAEPIQYSQPAHRPAQPAPAPTVLQHPGMRFAWVAAAAVGLIACGVWLGNWMSRTTPSDESAPQILAKAPEANPLPPRDTKPPAFAGGESLSAKVMKCDLRLAKAQTVRERVEALVELADVLQRETRLLAKSTPSAKLEKLAGLYKRVLEEGVVARARDLAMDERKDVLPQVTAQLTKTRLDVERSAVTLPDAADALRQIASAAGDADVVLRELMREAAE